MDHLMQDNHSIKDIPFLHKSGLRRLNNMICHGIKSNGGHFREYLETYV
jgi:hypothetical protein